MSIRRFILLATALATPALQAQQQAPIIVEHGVYGVHLLERTIGQEVYDISDFGDHLQLTVTAHTTDRGLPSTLTTTLDYLPSLTPTRLQQQSITGTTTTTSLLEITGNKVTITDAGTTRTFLKPPIAFTGFATMPAAAQMLMMRYWLHHHRPPHLSLLRAAQSLPVEIRPVGFDVFTIHGEIVRLTRYTVANLVFGREVLWMNDSERIAAIMTFANGLPREEILDEYKSDFDPLFQSGVSQELLDLAALTRSLRPLATGTFAITGARLIDATGKPPIENSTVLIRNNRIAAAGPASAVHIPPGTRIVRATGESILPGFWKLNTHVSGAEFGPALLANGITTARDCGGEFHFLLALRHALDEQHQLGPRLFLAGLIDGGGIPHTPAPFGLFAANTPGEGRGAVDMYAEAHFDQIAPYTHLQPDVLAAITDESAKHNLSIANCSTNPTDDLLTNELEINIPTGMTPLEVIQSLTLDPARQLHQEANSGTITPGKRADLVLVNGNPLTDITTLHNVASVITNGRMYNATALARSVNLHR